MSVQGCLACDLADGRRELPGGVIYERDGWIVEHCIGPLGVGTLIVKPRRHVPLVAELGDAEADALGPLIAVSCRVVTESPSPSRCT